jgi:hypothetical protein
MNIFFKKKSYIINIITIKKKKPLTTFITVFFSPSKGQKIAYTPGMKYISSHETLVWN